MTKIFDGRKFAKEKELLLSKKVARLLRKGIKPKLASILIGNDPASILYVSLKKKAAERIRAGVEILKYENTSTLRKEIENLNKDKKVHGIMIQLPLPKKFKKETQELINLIVPKKDIDGLREDSPYLPATVKAVMEIIEESKTSSKTVVVVGSSGMVGKPLVRELKKREYSILSDSKDADILVSATGDAGLIKGHMVKKEAVVIDVGAPYGDIDWTSFTSEARKALSFITPVPGGVGPVTISSLLENLLEAAYNNA